MVHNCYSRSLKTVFKETKIYKWNHDKCVSSPPIFCRVIAIPAAIFPGVPKALYPSCSYARIPVNRFQTITSITSAEMADFLFHFIFYYVASRQRNKIKKFSKAIRKKNLICHFHSFNICLDVKSHKSIYKIMNVLLHLHLKSLKFLWLYCNGIEIKNYVTNPHKNNNIQ